MQSMHAKLLLAATLVLGPSAIRASWTPDVSLEQLIPESDIVVAGVIESIQETNVDWILGSQLHVAKVVVDTVAMGKTQANVYVRFAPNLSDEPVLDVSIRYVLFLVRAREADARALGIDRSVLYEVSRFDRSAVGSYDGIVYPYAIQGQTEQPESQFIERICTVVAAQRRAYGASCPRIPAEQH
jgi:hypothetical protein